jgi:hypothetical protein
MGKYGELVEGALPALQRMLKMKKIRRKELLLHLAMTEKIL